MQTPDLSSFEQLLLNSIRAYARARESGTDEEQDLALSDVCSGTARLLGQLLEADNRWNRYWWVDSILPIGMDNPSPLENPELRLYVIVIWGQKGLTAEWGEPCSIVLSEVSGELKYQICVGDAHRGLGKVPYAGTSETIVSLMPDEWQFMFSN
jgi:hypothetical protein